MPYISSTTTGSRTYPIYKKSPDGTLFYERVIKIAGGANVINKKTLLTPRGAVTHVSDEDLEYLKQNKSFMRLMDNGFVCIHGDKKFKGKDLNPKDSSAQKVDSDFREAGEPLPRDLKGRVGNVEYMDDVLKVAEGSQEVATKASSAPTKKRCRKPRK